MMRLPTLPRALPLVRRHWRLLARSAAGLAAARFTLLTGPFDRAIRFGCVPVDRRPKAGSVGEIVWAVEAIARRVPFRTKCIEQGMAAQRLLRRAGIDARLHYGINPGDRLEAHVWVSVDGKAVVGGQEAGHFREVAAYPG